MSAFSISKTLGFLPASITSFLPDTSALNKQLNKLAKSLPSCLAAKTLRSEIEKINKIHADDNIIIEKNAENQLHGATLILNMLAQSYIWEKIEDPANRLPAVLAKNIYLLCKMEKRYPILTYSDYVLYNWQTVDNKTNTKPENIKPLITFTGTQDEAWFISIHVAIEAASGRALHAACEAVKLANYMLSHQSCPSEIEDKLCKTLHIIAESLHFALCVLKQMPDNCNPDFYYTTLRYYLNGWDIITNQQGQAGICFVGLAGSDKHNTYQYKGASGAQSSIVPALDAALGIQHDRDAMYQTLLTFQQYMPHEHRRFIASMHQSRIREAVMQSNHVSLLHAWKKAVYQIGEFRSGHLELVRQYIYEPAAKRSKNTAAIKGTGGSLVTSYLGNRYKNTLALL